MSPAAIGGSHLRNTSVNRIVPVNPIKKDGLNGISTLKAGDRVLPHLNDLVTAKPLVDSQSSMRKLLEAGEAAAKQAETWLDFKRPELALQEYIIACTIAVDYIPHNPHYPDLRNKLDYLRIYSGLQKRLDAQHSRFEAVKRLIKEDNSRSGISPSNKFPHAGEPVSSNGKHNAFGTDASGPHNSASDRKLAVTNISEGADSRPKPVVHPKPQGLHGRSIHAVNGIASNLSTSPENDLTARFARLKSSSNATVVQDPRIRTQPIIIPDETAVNRKLVNAVSPPKQNASTLRPLGPREMPSTSSNLLRTEKPILGMDTSVPIMPRMPDAIYSPARSADVVSNTSQPPSLMSRGSSNFNGRRDSLPPVQKASQIRIVADDATDYFSNSEVNNYTSDNLNHEFENPTSSLPAAIPDATTLTAEQLYNFLKMGSHALSLLLVDIRNREEFDEGHIMSQSIICIEPISIQRDMSAEELGERIVLSPESEQRLYERRHTFDLIVYYDQSSMLTNPDRTPVEHSNYLHHFSAIIYDHTYDHRLKRRPMLLSGGLDAWVDLVGPGALQGANPANRSQIRLKRYNNHSLGRVSMVRESRKGLVTKRPVPRSRILSKAEENKWDMALKNHTEADDVPIEEMAMDESYYVRTTEDFMRRYPELPAAKQSMAPSSMPRTLPSYDGSMISAPPTRPPPALPRQRSNGISEKTPYKSYTMTGGNPSAPPAVEHGLCGLRNITGGLCYMNSCIQALSASPAIRNMMIRFQYPCPYEIPKKQNEDGPPKLLMVRALRSLLQHLWCGKYEEIVPRMFQQYVHAAAVQAPMGIGSGTPGSEHEHNSDTTFGTQRQHDANEFMGWLLEILLDELNMHRDRDVEHFVRDENGEQPISQSCRHAYERALEVDDSPLRRLVSTQMITDTQCHTCKQSERFAHRLDHQLIAGYDSAISGRLSLYDIIDDLVANVVRGNDGTPFDCDFEGVKACRIKTFKELFSYLPDYLIVPLKASQRDFRANTRIDFPEVLNMEKYTWLAEKDDFSERVLPQQKPPFLYDCYAVIQHSGSKAAGHYWTIARRVDEHNEWTNEWHEFNDSRVISGKTFAHTQTSATVMVLYRRQGAE